MRDESDQKHKIISGEETSQIYFFSRICFLDFSCVIFVVTVKNIYNLFSLTFLIFSVNDNNHIFGCTTVFENNKLLLRFSPALLAFFKRIRYTFSNYRSYFYNYKLKLKKPNERIHHNLSSK